MDAFRKNTRRKRKTTKRPVQNIQDENLEEYHSKYKIYKNQEFPQSRQQYTDNLFPPNDNSLIGQDTVGKFSQEIETLKSNIIPSQIEWKCSRKILFEPHMFEGELSTKNISTGIITNSYFLTAVEALCKYPNLITKIFLTKNYEKEKSIYELLLFIDGEYQIVLLDDYFPCIKGTSVPYFSKPTTFELWFMLLEKAWAKVNGGYGNILVGNVSEVFLFLTGFCSEQINNEIIDEKNYSDIIKKSLENKDIICLSTKNEEEVEQMGLVKDNNYILCDIVEVKVKKKQKTLLCKLKNPILTENNWKGDWSNESDLWTDKINKQIKEDVLETKNNEFFINIEDLLKYFYRTDICHILFNGYSKSFNFTKDDINFNEPQTFNFYLYDKGKISILISENNWKFHNELQHYSHPTSLVLAEYNPKNINDIKNIFTSFESDKDIELTLTLNGGFYFLWIFKYFLNEEDNKNNNMKIKLLSESKFNIMQLDPDSDFQVIKKIIYEKKKAEKEKENLINDSEIFHYITNEFKDSGLAYRMAINPLSTKYQKWDVDPSSSETTDFTIVSPKLNPKEPFTVYLETNNHIMIIAIRNKKYGQFTFNTEIDAEEFDNEKDPLKKEENKNENEYDIKNYFICNKNQFEQITTKETGSLKDISKKEEYPIVAHDKIFVEKYSKKTKLVEQLLNMEQDDNNKNKKLRWAKIKKENGVYLGEAEQNLPQGRGCFIYKGSQKGETLQWVGYFDNGEKSKFGKLYNDEGRLIYEGEYKNGIRNGEGTYHYNRGLKYEGEFANGLREGHGVFQWEDGTRWEGPFKNNEMHGQGTYYHKDESYPVTYNNGEIVE